MTGRKVDAAGLFLNSLRLSIGGGFGEKAGMFVWLDPVWHLGSARGILVGSRQAQVEHPDTHAALNDTVQELVGQTLKSVSIENLTNDIDITFSGGYWVKTFVSDPADDSNWYFRYRERNISVIGSANGLRIDRSTPLSENG